MLRFALSLLLLVVIVMDLQAGPMIRAIKARRSAASCSSTMSADSCGSLMSSASCNSATGACANVTSAVTSAPTNKATGWCLDAQGNVIECNNPLNVPAAVMLNGKKYALVPDKK